MFANLTTTAADPAVRVNLEGFAACSGGSHPSGALGHGEVRGRVGSTRAELSTGTLEYFSKHDSLPRHDSGGGTQAFPGQ